MTAGLSNESRALLERAKRQGGPTPAQTAKIGAAVFAATTATAATATATAATVATASGGGTAVAASSSLITMIGAGLVATALGIGGTVAVKRALAPPAPPPRVVAPMPAPPPTVPSVQPIVVAPPVEQPTEAVAPPVVVPTPLVATPRPAARVEVKPDVVAAEPTPEVPHLPKPSEPAPPVVRHQEQPVDSTAAQVAALTAAVEALEQHQPEVARSTAREARLADRNGALAPELMVVEITALCELGRRNDALSLSRQMTAAEQTPLVRGKLGRTCVGTEK
ncbi:MAG: hypothetical protein GQE15_02540 [Archangiaceae bacterium]|nr:hypothetical protein [Archangiaceae bacterium]